MRRESSVATLPKASLEQLEAIVVMREVVKKRRSGGESHAEEWSPNIGSSRESSNLTAPWEAHSRHA